MPKSRKRKRSVAEKFLAPGRGKPHTKKRTRRMSARAPEQYPKMRTGSIWKKKTN